MFCIHGYSVSVSRNLQALARGSNKKQIIMEPIISTSSDHLEEKSHAVVDIRYSYVANIGTVKLGGQSNAATQADHKLLHNIFIMIVQADCRLISGEEVVHKVGTITGLLNDVEVVALEKPLVHMQEVRGHGGGEEHNLG